MTLKYTKVGIAYHVPPFTRAEEAEFYRRLGQPPIALIRGPALTEWVPPNETAPSSHKANDPSA